MTHEATRQLDAPVGRLLLAANETGLTRVGLRGGGESDPAIPSATTPASSAHLDTAARALDAYFRGELQDFDEIVLAPLTGTGTDFQLKVWEALRAIPFGSTESYGELARRIGQPGAARAVGMANHRNPLAIVIPCHRVIGASGKLVGYAGGVEMKRRLLEHEGVV